MDNGRWTMANRTSNFVCQQCGYSQVGWAGRCPNCGSWGSLVETIEAINKRKVKSEKHKELEVIELTKVKGEGLRRISSGIHEVDRVLGGGIVPGQVVLLAGEPGIGKSTLLSQIAEKIYSPSQRLSRAGGANSKKKNILYVSGEESASQIKLRIERLGLSGKDVFVIGETDVDEILEVISNQLLVTSALVIVDSIQTLSTTDLSGMAGSVGQVRECAARLIAMGKQNSVPVFLVGHVTKEGTIAGPRVLEHMVDTVLWFEGDRAHVLRLLRAVKNRFGPTDEVGIFTMEERGLHPVENPSSLFISGLTNVPGQVSTVIVEGTRPLIVEIQALVVPTKMPFPRRTVQGLDARRVEFLLAVATRRAGIQFDSFDVFVNVPGGISIREPAADLAILLALTSAALNKPLPPHAAIFGEVGLLGEVRPVSQERRRIKEARRLGFKTLVTSSVVRTVGEAIKRFVK